MSSPFDGIPAPLYKNGDLVWLPMIETKTEQHPCPDCNDTKIWRCEAPSGLVGEISCPRCVPGFRISSVNIPTLNFQRAVPRVRSLTIGSVKIDTAAQDAVCYMCLETGIGSGSVYREELLFPDEVSAMAHAYQMANEKSEEYAARPEAMKSAVLGKQPVTLAALAAIEQRHTEYYTQRDRLIELCTGIIEPNENDSDRPQTFDDLVEHIRDEYESAMKSRHSSPGLLAKIANLMNEISEATTLPGSTQAKMDEIIGLLEDLRA